MDYKETDDHIRAREPSTDVLCGTLFLGDASFTLQFPDAAVLVIGRDEGSDIPIVSGSVSREHAALEVRGHRATIIDRKSRNGTTVNGTPIGNENLAVGHGDEIGIGDARLALFRRTSLPAPVRALLVRKAFVAELDALLASGTQPVSLVVAQFDDPWYEQKAGRDVILSSAESTSLGLYSPRIVLFASRDVHLHDRVRHAVRSAALDVTLGVSSGAHTNGRSLLDSALRDLIDNRRKAAEQPVAAPSVFVSDPRMLELHAFARRIAPSSVSVLIVGETGTGKEVFAREIHRASGRSGPLVSVNTAALPESLVESELFGHERGAFSGAAQAKAGLIEAADKGTLFLDEIGELPLAMQAKLLRVLEDYSVRRVGSTTERKIDVRVITATNRNLEESVAEGRFRQDLLYRLNAAVIQIPPLRERAGEIARLASEFLNQASRAGAEGIPAGVARETIELLERYHWPGNVRELRNVVDRAVAVTRGISSVILPEHLPENIRTCKAAPPGFAPNAERNPGTSPPPPLEGSVRDSLKDFERDRIVAALEKCGGSQTKAAALLGLPRRTLAYKMARLGIKKSTS